MNIIGYTESGAIRAQFEGYEGEVIVPDDMGNRHRQMIAEWESMGNTIEPYIPTEPVITPPTPSVTASAKLTIADGIMKGFAADSQIAGGFQLDIGKFMLFFDTPITSPYIVSAFDGGLYRIYVEAEDYEDDYFTVTCTDLSGTLSDPSNMSVLIITT